MGLRNSREEWGAIAKFLHWTIVVLIAGLIPFGWYLAELREAGDTPPLRLVELYALHKSVGILVLALILLRLLWRLVNPTPELPATMPALERLAAHGTHWLLYLLLILMPLSGYVVHTNFPLDSPFFGTVAIPKLFHADEAQRDAAVFVHRTLTYAILALVGLHAAAALRHHFFKRDRILLRMLPRL